MDQAGVLWVFAPVPLLFLINSGRFLCPYVE
jgi:hypothetical protein